MKIKSFPFRRSSATVRNGYLGGVHLGSENRKTEERLGKNEKNEKSKHRSFADHTSLIVYIKIQRNRKIGEKDDSDRTAPVFRQNHTRQVTSKPKKMERTA